MPSSQNALQILLVEDQFLVADEIKARITTMGHKVSGIAATATEAMQLFQQKIPHLILMDIHLDGSDRDGIELAAAIRKDWDIPIILLTDHTEDMHRKRAAREELHYLTKPFTETALAGLLQSLFPEGPQAARSRQSRMQETILLHEFRKDFDKLLPLKQVLRLQASKNYCELWYWPQGQEQPQKHLETKAMGTLLEIIEQKNATEDIRRVHNSHAVNMRYGDGKEGNELVLRDGTKILVGRKYREYIFGLLQ